MSICHKVFHKVEINFCCAIISFKMAPMEEEQGDQLTVATVSCYVGRSSINTRFLTPDLTLVEINVLS